MTGTIARKTGRLHVHVFGFWPVCAINFSRDQSSDKLINFLDSQLDTRDSRLDPRDSRLDTRNYRGSSIESRGSRDCQLTFERYRILGYFMRCHPMCLQCVHYSVSVAFVGLVVLVV